MLYILMSTITTRINIIEFVLTTKPYLFEYYLDKLLVFYVLKNSYYQYIRTYSSLYSSLFLFISSDTCVYPILKTMGDSSFLKNPTVDIFRPTAISFF